MQIHPFLLNRKVAQLAEQKSKKMYLVLVSGPFVYWKDYSFSAREARIVTGMGYHFLSTNIGSIPLLKMHHGENITVDIFYRGCALGNRRVRFSYSPPYGLLSGTGINTVIGFDSRQLHQFIVEKLKIF